MSRSFYRVYERALQKDAPPKLYPMHWNLSGLQVVVGAIGDLRLLPDRLPTVVDLRRNMYDEPSVEPPCPLPGVSREASSKPLSAKELRAFLDLPHLPSATKEQMASRDNDVRYGATTPCRERSFVARLVRVEILYGASRVIPRSSSRTARKSLLGFLDHDSYPSPLGFCKRSFYEG